MFYSVLKLYVLLSANTNEKREHFERLYMLRGYVKYLPYQNRFLFPEFMTKTRRWSCFFLFYMSDNDFRKDRYLK